MVPLIVLIVVLAVGGGVALLVKSKKAAAASKEAGAGPNEFLRSPPTSFPSSSGSARSLEAGPESPSDAVEPASTVVSEPIIDEDEADDQDDDDDDVIIARFKAPGARSVGSGGPDTPVSAPPVYHLEGPPIVAGPVADPEPVAEVEPESEAAPPAGPVVPVLALVPDAPEPEIEPEPKSDLHPESEPEPESEPVSVASDGPVIDLIGAQAVVTPAEAVVSRRVDDEAWADVVLQPEPDAVDHVLQALINRARFKQVEVEAVATELVERADLQGQEVSDVLAELVGRADDSTLDAARTSELTLFNDEVPSRPGQLTDFARLAPAEKKRIIVRVLCLLVARSEDQQLPPRAEGETAEPRAWPLARAVWPLAGSDDDGEAQLPSRRLAKSG
jgi:hypothetical protein